MRRHVFEEIRYVSSGPAAAEAAAIGGGVVEGVEHAAAPASSAAHAARAAKVVGPSAATPPSAPPTKQVRRANAGAIVQDPVPHQLRGQNLLPTMRGIPVSALRKMVVRPPPVDA